jgi:hypothetical protein
MTLTTCLFCVINHFMKLAYSFSHSVKIELDKVFMIKQHALMHSLLTHSWVFPSTG